MALFRAEGVDARIVRAYDGAPPAVIGEKRGPEGAPVVLLYAHHDVQPENDPAEWDSPPWEPTERDGRLYGRGAADDKAGIMAHIAALRVLGDDLPVTVRLFIEGEEEVASATLSQLLEQNLEQLRADVIVIADSGNWDIGVPALTTSLRGLVRVNVEVRTLTHAVHQGMWGGLVPDAVITLSRLSLPSTTTTATCWWRAWSAAPPPTSTTRRSASAPSPGSVPAWSGWVPAPRSSDCGPNPPSPSSGSTPPRSTGPPTP